MSKGKFSSPRPYRDEEREIEQAFRQMTGQAPQPDPQPEPEPLDCQPLTEGFPDLAQMPELSPEMIPETPEELYPMEEEEPDFVDKAQAFFRKASKFCGENPKIILVSLCALALVMILAFMAIFFVGTSDPYGGKILDNVYLGSTEVGGLTKKEAVQVLKASAERSYSTQDMVIDLAGTPLRLSPSDTGITLDVKSAVEAAYAYGRTGSKEQQEQIYLASRDTAHYIGLLPYLDLDQAYVRQVLRDYSKDTGSTLTQANYGLEGRQPELATDKFDESAPCQTLVITMGTPGVGFDAEAVLKQVLDAYSLNTFLVTVAAVEPDAEPDPVDLEAIYEEVYIAPVDDSLDLQTFEPVPGSYGYGFDLEEAQALIDAAGYGEEVRIPMEYIEPEIMGEDVLYRDVLGSCETPITRDADRNTNLRLACEALNNLVLMPGEAFSYNKTLGERTAAKGYKPAPSYSGLETVDTIGGGICQVSTTLYYSVLLADLRVTDRVNHGFVPSYIDMGMDATVSWGGPDFGFVNSTNFPLKIQAEVSDGYVRIQLLGTDEKDYYVKMEYDVVKTYKPDTKYEEFPADDSEGYEDGDVIKEGVTGYQVKSYKVKYDKLTDRRLSRNYESTSTYKKVDKVIAQIIHPETEPPTEAPTEPSTEAPTEPPETTAPTEPPETAPPTEPTVTEPEPTQPSTETPEVPEE